MDHIVQMSILDTLFILNLISHVLWVLKMSRFPLLLLATWSIPVWYTKCNNFYLPKLNISVYKYIITKQDDLIKNIYKKWYYQNFAGITGADDCDYGNPYEKCNHLIPRDKLKDIHIVPDKDELMAICP